jgi:hypothetical protein
MIQQLLSLLSDINSNFSAVGTFGVWATGRILDLTNQDWSYVFGIIAVINIVGAIAFLLLFDSNREFD